MNKLDLVLRHMAYRLGVNPFLFSTAVVVGYATAFRLSPEAAGGVLFWFLGPYGLWILTYRLVTRVFRPVETAALPPAPEFEARVAPLSQGLPFADTWGQTELTRAWVSEVPTEPGNNGSRAVNRALPEDITEGRLSLAPSDVFFLYIQAAHSTSVHFWDPAIYMLTQGGCSGALSKETAAEALMLMLMHPEPARRVMAAPGLTEVVGVDALPCFLKALEVEEHKVVRMRLKTEIDYIKRQTSAK